MARPFLYCCPNTGWTVQSLLEREPSAAGGRYEAVRCPACRGFHFVDVATFKLLSDEDKGDTAS